MNILFSLNKFQLIFLSSIFYFNFFVIEKLPSLHACFTTRFSFLSHDNDEKNKHSESQEDHVQKAYVIEKLPSD